MQLISLEGNRQKLDAGAMFGNAPKALWSRWVNVDEHNRMELATRALLAKNLNGKNVLFETGIGDCFQPKLKQRYGVYEDGHKLLESLQSVGMDPADIDVIVLSHMHFDHAGGLLNQWQADKEPQLAFPQAQVLVGSEHWQRAIDPHPRDRASFLPELHQLLMDADRLHFVTGQHHELLGKLVSFEFSNGHTPGLMLSQVSDIIFATDLIPATPWVHVPLSMGYDRFPEQLIDEKKTLLNRVVANKLRLFYTHDLNVAISEVSHDDGRFKPINSCKTLNQEL